MKKLFIKSKKSFMGYHHFELNKTYAEDEINEICKKIISILQIVSKMIIKSLFLTLKRVNQFTNLHYLKIGNLN